MNEIEGDKSTEYQIKRLPILNQKHQRLRIEILKYYIKSSECIPKSIDPGVRSN